MENLNTGKVNEKIREMIKDKLNLNIDSSQINDEFMFGTSNGFDSTTLLEFILELEDEFDLIIPDEDLLPDNFASIDKITNYIIRMKEE